MPRKTCQLRLSWNLTKFNMLARFHETIPTVKSVSSSEIQGINFIFLTEITILPFFHKLEFLGSYKKPSKASFMLKKSSRIAILGTPRPLSLKKTRRSTKTPQKLGESWDGLTLKCYRAFFMKGCKGKRRPFSKAASKKQTILGTGTI